MFLLFFWYSHYAYVSVFNGVPPFSETLFLFLHSFCPQVYRDYAICKTIFKFVDSSATSNLLSPSSEIFISGYHTFQLQNCHFFGFIIWLFVDILYLVIICSFNSLRLVSFRSLNIFIIVALKSLLTPTSGSPQIQFLLPAFLTPPCVWVCVSLNLSYIPYIHCGNSGY